MKIEDRPLGMWDEHHGKPLPAFPDEKLDKIADSGENASRLLSETVYDLFLDLLIIICRRHRYYLSLLGMS